MSDNPWIPRDPISIPIRPLIGGIDLASTPQLLPAGSFLDLKNFICREDGIQRRPGLSNYTIAGSAVWSPLQFIGTSWKIDGTQFTVAIDKKFLYIITGGAFVRYAWTYAIGTCSNVGTAVTGAGGSLWDTAASEVRAGDTIILDADGVPAEEHEILSITDDTHLVLSTTPAVNHPGGTDYIINRAFGAAEPYLVDTAVVPGATNKLIITDNVRFAYSFDGATLTDFNAVENDIIPAAVAYFQDRVWLLNTQEGGVHYRQRIRASDVFPNVDDFAGGDNIYTDLPYHRGAGLRLVPLGNFLAVYFEDSIAVGRGSQIPGSPLVFQNAETGGIGLVGQRAVVPFVGGHFLVGQDDIYFFSNQGLQGIGSKVVKKTIRECHNLWRVYGAWDMDRDRIIFGFPKNGDLIEQLWSFNYKTKAWAYDEIGCSCLNTSRMVEQITWGDLYHADEGGVIVDMTGEVDTGPGGGGAFKSASTTVATAVVTGLNTTWVTDGVIPTDLITVDVDDDDGGTVSYEVLSVDAETQITMVSAGGLLNTTQDYAIERSTWTDLGGTFPTWAALQSISGAMQLYLGKDLNVNYYNEHVGDDNGAPIDAIIETGDLDLDKPNDIKTFYKFSLKLREHVDTALDFVVYGSTNRGRTWKGLGTLNIPIDRDEGRINFRMRGSTMRLKLVSYTSIVPYTITEMVIRAKLGGLEVQSRSD